ncbi:MAG: hypothetical protein GVY30_04085 [Chloroflexi bacterium]|nr:hypothetical protein [Chloroflexota bacterium]
MPLPRPERPDDATVHTTSVATFAERNAFRMLAPPDLPPDEAGAPLMPLDAPTPARIIIVDAAGIAVEENVERVPPPDDEFRLIRDLDGGDEVGKSKG